MKTLTTYKNYPDSPETTSWAYNSRGFMISKTYPDGKSVSYTYNSAGRILTRTWSRGITTTYAYNSAGDLISVDYSDSTPDITYTRDRLGRISSVTDAAGTRTFTYNPDSTVATETIPYLADYSLGYSYDTLGRRSAMTLKQNTNVIQNVTYAYDAMSNLASVSDGNMTASYSRIPGSSLLSQTVINNGTEDILTVTRTHDNLNRLTNIQSDSGGSTVKSYAYNYNDRDLRIKATLSDGSYWEYTYDDLGQLTSAIKYDSSGNAIPGYTFDYNFDTIGNRKSADISNELLHYTSNELNQYTQITDGDTISLSYDDDGNLLSDGRFTYTWNGENRLIRVESPGNAALQSGIEFSYDYKGRRIEKKVYENGVLTKHIKYIYDGWNVIAEIEDDNLAKTYVWGEDLSGTLQGAGGVGGLLAVRTATDTYYPFYDGNGNITAYTDTSGTTVYTCEYTPFGKVLSFTGTSPCNFGFSTKYTDTETKLIYYGYRYYSPELGRWLSRDPIEEKGGVNLYCFVNNDAISNYDLLGLKALSVSTDIKISSLNSGVPNIDIKTYAKAYTRRYIKVMLVDSDNLSILGGITYQILKTWKSNTPALTVDLKFTNKYIFKSDKWIVANAHIEPKNKRVIEIARPYAYSIISPGDKKGNHDTYNHPRSQFDGVNASLLWREHPGGSGYSASDMLTIDSILNRGGNTMHGISYVVTVYSINIKLCDILNNIVTGITFVIKDTGYKDITYLNSVVTFKK